MKRISRMLGVTLLEIMLVLAIAAMVIVMSIRYYATTTQSQQANALVGQILALTAAADNLAVGTGSYSGITASQLTSIAGPTSLSNPWGATVTAVSGTGGATAAINFTISPMPIGVCNSTVGKLAPDKSGSRFASGTKCTGSGNNAQLLVKYTLVPKP